METPEQRLLRRQERKIASLLTAIEMLNDDRRRLQGEVKRYRNLYRELMATCRLMGKDIAAIIHLEKYLNLYQSLFEKCSSNHQNHMNKYGRFYEELDSKLGRKHD